MKTRLLLPLAGLMALATGCADSVRSKPLRLKVGEIREITLSDSADSTLRGTSENPEVVDVSRKQTTAPDAGKSGPAVFLIKGVTVGTARVIFSENPPGAVTSAPSGQNAARTRRTYTVRVGTN